MGDMLKSWRGVKAGEKSQWICHLQAKHTNSALETLSFNLRLQSPKFLVLTAGKE